MPPIRPLVASGCLLALALLAAPGLTQSVLTTRLGTVPNSLLGTVTRAVGDQDGDGITDFVVSEPSQSTTIGGRAFLISGATRATLATFQGQIAQPNTWGMGHHDVNPIGDVNGDGRGDFAIGYVNLGHLDVFSGLTGARLYARGFSRPAPSGRPDLPERFVWEELEPAPRWDQHPGRYTRYGEVAALLGASDDRFVILGSGDALTLRFGGVAASLPALPEGWTRDYVLYLDGWAKDRDPNTLEALEVEPLPFHGMSGYPYGPGERFPDSDAHRAWRAEWNTRDARRWRAPLATAARAAWTRELLGE